MAVLSFVLRSALDSLSFCCMICQMFEILLFIYQVFLVLLNHDTGFAVVLLYMIRPMLRYFFFIQIKIPVLVQHFTLVSVLCCCMMICRSYFLGYLLTSFI